MEVSKINTIKRIIKKGILRHGEILSELYKTGITNIDADEIAMLVIRNKYNLSLNTTGKLIKTINRFLDSIISYIMAIIGAITFAEIYAAKEFAGTLLAEKLKGFGDNLLYWLGFKSIQITGPEMFNAMTKLITATPKIMKGLLIGLIVGFIAWKLLKIIIYFIYKQIKLQLDVYALARKSFK